MLVNNCQFNNEVGAELLVNNASGHINVHDGGIGIEVAGSGHFTNDGGEMEFSNNYSYSIANNGNFLNTNCGLIKGEAKLGQGGTYFVNEGWMEFLYTNR